MDFYGHPYHFINLREHTLPHDVGGGEKTMQKESTEENKSVFNTTQAPTLFTPMLERLQKYFGTGMDIRLRANFGAPKQRYHDITPVTAPDETGAFKAKYLDGPLTGEIHEFHVNFVTWQGPAFRNDQPPRGAIPRAAVKQVNSCGGHIP